MDRVPRAIHHVATRPAAHDPRSLTNLPSEILQILFGLVFDEAAVNYICHPTRTTRCHVTNDSCEMLLTCRRFYQEGLKIWYEKVVLDANYLIPDHLPASMVEQCKEIRLTFLSTQESPPHSLQAETCAITKFQHLEILELPQEGYEYSTPDSVPTILNDEEVLQMRSSLYGAYVEWAQEIVECLPKLTVKLQKEIYIHNIIDMYLICDIAITKDQTVVRRTLKRYLNDDTRIEGLESVKTMNPTPPEVSANVCRCLDDCKELLVQLGIDTTGTSWG